jgi:hypothetical protein
MNTCLAVLVIADPAGMVSVLIIMMDTGGGGHRMYWLFPV